MLETPASSSFDEHLRSVLGPAVQLGFVVRDVEAAMRHWIEVLGVGPFLFLEKGTGRPAPQSFFRKEPVHVEMRLAFGFIGDVQIELIEQVNDAPSPYREFLESGREGLQHFGFWVHDCEEACRRVEAAGYVLDFAIPIAGQIHPIVYYRAPDLVGAMVELVPPLWRRSREAVRKHLATFGGTVSTFATYGEFLAHAGVTFD
jgi:catechol 2,3-dioxygenase-like lactoylglutathione lyase family enzyme